MTDELARARAWNEANPDRVRAIRAKYAPRTPDVRASTTEKSRPGHRARAGGPGREPVEASRVPGPRARGQPRRPVRLLHRRAATRRLHGGAAGVPRGPRHSAGVRRQALPHNLRVISPGQPTDSNADLVT